VVAQRRGGAPSIAVTVLGIFWIGLALGHAVLLRDLPHGNAIVVDVLVGTFLGDTGAYLGGRAIGATRLAPRISPNKTWEGLGVGIIVAVVATWCAGLYQDWLSGPQALLLGFAVALVGPVGDLFESYLKRDAGTKDTGRCSRAWRRAGPAGRRAVHGGRGVLCVVGDAVSWCFLRLWSGRTRSVRGSGSASHPCRG